MSDDGYEHPIALPLSWVAVGAVVILINCEDVFGGDWVSAVVAIAGAFMAAIGVFDLVKRWLGCRA